MVQQPDELFRFTDSSEDDDPVGIADLNLVEGIMTTFETLRSSGGLLDLSHTPPPPPYNRIYSGMTITRISISTYLVDQKVLGTGDE